MFGKNKNNSNVSHDIDVMMQMMDKVIQGECQKKFRVCRRFEFVGQYSKQNRTEEKRCKKAG